MALTFLGTTSFSQCGPEQWRLGQFELDQMSVPFCGAVTGLTTYISSLTRGDAWSGDANMFLTGWVVSDSRKQYPTVTLEYIGAKGGVLPDARQDYQDQVQTASSARSNTGTVLSSPVSVQYYAPATTYSWFTANAPGNLASVSISDPSSDPRPITITCADSTFSVGPLFQTIIDEFFTQQIIDTFSSEEIVTGGKYYVNKVQRTKFLSPWIFDFGSGPIFGIYSPGVNYQVGDILAIYGSPGTGTVQVTQVGISNSITGFTELTNTFTTNQSNLSAAGGSGSGARFYCVVVP